MADVGEQMTSKVGMRVGGKAALRVFMLDNTSKMLLVDDHATAQVLTYGHMRLGRRIHSFFGPGRVRDAG